MDSVVISDDDATEQEQDIPSTSGQRGRERQRASAQCTNVRQSGLRSSVPDQEPQTVALVTAFLAKRESMRSRQDSDSSD
eukprot:3881264-Rhodomonas_salina.1